MSLTTQQNWFTETHLPSGTAFSLQIKQQLYAAQTPFQKIEIYATEHFGNLMVLDGCIMLTQRDNFLYHEMISHIPLHTHAAPRQVVIIGGGDCGTLQEVLKHSEIEQATQVEIDPQVTACAEKYFPELCRHNHDPRAKLLFVDGIEWMRQAPSASLDIIIVDSTDPAGPATGLFNVDFYQQCARALKPDGLLVQQSESPLIHLALQQQMREAMHQSGLTNLLTYCFPQPVYPTGWWSATMASKSLKLDQFRQPSAALSTHYYNAGIHLAALQSPNLWLKPT
jgi:spermidine synthase